MRNNAVVNPLMKLDWHRVRMLSFDEGVLSYRLEDEEVQQIEFPSKRELDSAFAEWVESYQIGATLLERKSKSPGGTLGAAVTFVSSVL